MKPREREAVSPPRQLTLALDSVKLRGLSTSERGAVVALLAGLLLEAGGVVERENDNDGV
jgi:hypothetical protein